MDKLFYKMCSEETHQETKKIYFDLIVFFLKRKKLNYVEQLQKSWQEVEEKYKLENKNL